MTRENGLKTTLYRERIKHKMKLHSYIASHDTGFAPNPFWDYCTLACCKPAIRRTANVGDWIVGLSIKSKGNRIVYVMEVTEKMTFADYFNDPRFKDKMPDMSSKQVERQCGDNIYEPLPGGTYHQLQSRHSDKDKKADLGGKFVLISSNFSYFGSKTLKLPDQFSDFIVARGHRNRFPQKLINEFISNISKEKRGIIALPEKWSANIKSCRTKTV